MTIYESLPEAFPASETAVALGIFDGLHLGHMAVIKTLVEISQNERLAPCMFTFNTTTLRPAMKTGERLLSEAMRNKILEKTGIEYVLMPDFSQFRDMGPKDFSLFLTRYLNVKAVFCGEDFRFGKGAKANAADLKSFLDGLASVHIIKTVTALGSAISATRIKRLLQEGDVAVANKLLGRPFSISAPVVRGRGIGHRHLLPTANQVYPENFAVPRFGVYASEAAASGRRYASVTNIGVKPTVGGAPLLAETHIFDFSGDLYGEEITVTLLAFIRGEEKFDGLTALKAQMEKDSVLAREIYSAYFAQVAE